MDGQQETLTFWWKVSSEDESDYLQFYIDGQLQHEISGEVGWQQKSYDISGQGSHTLKWRYVKDYADPNGDDCGWVDWVQWTGSPDPTPDPPPDPTKWKTIDYTYDPGGRRIKKTIDDDYSLKYVYDGGNVIAEYDHDNFLLRKYIYGPGVDEPVCMIDAADNDAEYYYHYDGLGSVVALSDSAGDTVQTYEYSVYGQVAAEDPNFLTNPYMFTGRRFDIETGLYYYRARYYNPHIGRFLQTDPIGYGAGINWYTYCWNNPLNLADPSGSFPILIDLNPIFDFFKTPRNCTITSGTPTWLQVTLHAIHGNGGRLTYTDTAACWEWAMAEATFRAEMMNYATDFLLDFWQYARINFCDRNTGTFNLEGWDYKYPLSGTYRTPSTAAKVYFSDEYGWTSAYYWIHNVVVVFDYTISFDEDQGGLTMTADIKIIDTMDLETENLHDYVLDKIFTPFGYTRYPLRIYLGTHTIGYRHLPDENGIQGFTLDGKTWP